jgi:hypothetical protein
VSARVIVYSSLRRIPVTGMPQHGGTAIPLAQKLESHRRYSLVRVGAVEYAFSSYEGYTRAMGEIWSAGLVPEPLPSTLGADVPSVAPHLRDVDPDLGDLTAADVRRPRRFV